MRIYFSIFDKNENCAMAPWHMCYNNAMAFAMAPWHLPWRHGTCVTKVPCQMPWRDGIDVGKRLQRFVLKQFSFIGKNENYVATMVLQQQKSHSTMVLVKIRIYFSFLVKNENLLLNFSCCNNCCNSCNTSAMTKVPWRHGKCLRRLRSRLRQLRSRLR